MVLLGWDTPRVALLPAPPQAVVPLPTAGAARAARCWGQGRHPATGGIRGRAAAPFKGRSRKQEQAIGVLQATPFQGRTGCAPHGSGQSACRRLYACLRSRAARQLSAIRQSEGSRLLEQQIFARCKLSELHTESTAAAAAAWPPRAADRRPSRRLSAPVIPYRYQVAASSQ